MVQKQMIQVVKVIIFGPKCLGFNRHRLFPKFPSTPFPLSGLSFKPVIEVILGFGIRQKWYEDCIPPLWIMKTSVNFAIINATMSLCSISTLYISQMFPHKLSVGINIAHGDWLSHAINGLPQIAFGPGPIVSWRIVCFAQPTDEDDCIVPKHLYIL